MSDATDIQPTWLLHHQAYRDTSLIIDVFTLAHGRVALMARSARAARPAIRELYQPFRPLLVSWVGQGELKTLTGIEPAGKPLVLEPKPQACAYYLSELVLRLCSKGDRQSELFALYGLALSELADGVDVELVLRRFELQLLESLGVLPDFARATRDGQSVDSAQRYRFHPANAIAVPVQGGVQDSATDWELPPLMKSQAINDGDAVWHADGVTADEGVEISGRSLLALAAMDVTDANMRNEIRPLMKRLIRLQLGDKPLNSRRLFETLAGS